MSLRAHVWIASAALIGIGGCLVLAFLTIAELGVGLVGLIAVASGLALIRRSRWATPLTLSLTVFLLAYLALLFVSPAAPFDLAAQPIAEAAKKVSPLAFLCAVGVYSTAVAIRAARQSVQT